MGKHQQEREHNRLGRAAKLNGASITVNTAHGAEKGTFKVSIGPLVPRGSTVLGTCTIHMHGGNSHGRRRANDAKAYLECDPLTGHLEIDGKGSEFKVNFTLCNFNLTSEAGTGVWGEQEAVRGEEAAFQAQGLSWHVNHWGREHAHDGRCDQIEIPIF